MKKKTTSKKSAPKTQKNRSKNTENFSKSLDDLGLEPPKIYRDSERAKEIQRGYSSQKNKQQLTKTERRARETKKRKKRSAIRKFFIWTAVVIFVTALGAVLSLTVFFHINSITVNSNKIYTNDEILSQCTIDVGENLFMSDIKSAEQRLEESLPYIYNAEIKRKLPDKIEIEITEAKVAYSIKNQDEKYIYLDDNFKVLELGAQKTKGIKISKADIKKAVAGFKIEFKNEDTGNCLEQLANVVKDNDFTEITSIYSNNISDNYVVYDGRIKFKLGNCDDLETKIYRGLAACEQLNESSPNVKGTMTISGDKSVYFTEDNT
ncbi:MAG: cell division protein FtsQ/DivIB [Eubacterium sp.]